MTQTAVEFLVESVNKKARVGVRVMRMYAAESDRITAEFRKYGC
jgi:hypothetical protein